MSQKPLAQKLLIKEDYRVLLVNSPPDYLSKLGKLPARTTITTTDSKDKWFDIVQLFVSSKAQLKEHLPKIKQLLNKNGILWDYLSKRQSRNQQRFYKRIRFDHRFSSGICGGC